MFKVEIIEDKPNYPPYVLVEDTLGHDTYHAPEDHQLTVKTDQQWSSKQKTKTKKEINKIAQSKPAKLRMKAPGNTKSTGPDMSGPSTWSDADVTMVYHRRKLDVFLESDPVIQSLDIQLLWRLGGPVSTLPRLQTVTDAITALVTLLREAGMVAGNFDPDELFTLGFDKITSTLTKLHKRLGILVGIVPTKSDLPPASHVTKPSTDSQMTLQDIEVDCQARPSDLQGKQGRPTQQDGSVYTQAVEERSSRASSEDRPVSRMPLGPTGAALLQARARGAAQEQQAQETTTRVQPMNNWTPDRLKFQPMGMQQVHTMNNALPRGEDAGGKRLPAR